MSGNIITHKIYFVRHGESSANLTHITTPPEEDLLTEKGKVQGELLGKYLKDQNVFFTRAYCSVFPRASESAKIILAANKPVEGDEVPLKEDPRLREKDLGYFMGRPAMDAYQALEDAYRNGTPVLKFEIPEAESTDDFENRLDSFLDELFTTLSSSTKPETILIIGHGICMFRIMGKLKSRTTEEIANYDEFKAACKRPMPNTGFHLLSLRCPYPNSPENNPRKVALSFLSYHQKPHLANLEKQQQVTDRADFTKMGKVYNMDLDMIAQCALQ